MSQSYNTTRQLLESQIQLGSERCKLPIPDSFQPGRSSIRGTVGASPADEEGQANCVFKKVDKAVSEYEGVRAALREAMQSCQIAETGLGEDLGKWAQAKGPELPPELAKEMDQMKSMCDQSHESFLLASEGKEKIRHLQQQLRVNETTQRAAEQNLIELTTQASQAQISISEKKAKGSQLEVVLAKSQYDPAAASQAADAQRQVDDLVVELQVLEQKLQKIESEKTEAQQKVVEGKQANQEGQAELARMSEKFQQINVPQMEAALTGQRQKLEPLLRKQHQEWRQILAEIQKNQIQLTKFSARSRDLTKSLYRESQARYRIIEAIASAREAMDAFDGSLRNIDDNELAGMMEQAGIYA